MVDFIHNNKDRYGVEAICRILPIAPSTYYRTLDLTDNPEHRAKRDEPYRVCRRVNILRDYPDDKTKLYPEIRERAVQLLIESEKIILLLGQQSQLLLLKSVVLLKHCVFGI